MVSVALLDTKDQSPMQWWSFEEQALISIGRALNNDVVVRDPLVSRYHLELRKIKPSVVGDRWQLTNQGKNGTFLNSSWVSQAAVTHGDIIQLAPQGPKLKVFFKLEDSLPANLQSAPLESLEPRRILELTRPQFKFMDCQGCGYGNNPRENLFCVHCGLPLRVRTTVRQYQVLKLLSEGGMGITFLARRESELVVLKQMNQAVSHLPKARELFEREALVLQQLSHPCVPRFLDFFAEANQLYLVMELVHGQNLEQYVQSQGPVSPAKTIHWGMQVCDILHYLHHQNPALVHRDIKPANLILRHRDKRIVVVDFGAVKSLNVPWGTRITAGGYTAPEQEEGQPCFQSDLYSLGATLIFLLTGKNPVSFHHYQAQTAAYYQAIIPGIDRTFAQVLSQVMQPQACDRPSSAQTLKAALQNCLHPAQSSVKLLTQD